MVQLNQSTIRPLLFKAVRVNNPRRLLKFPTSLVYSFLNLINLNLHYGGRTRDWNPQTRHFIFAERNNLYLMDLNYFFRQIPFVKLTLANILKFPYDHVLISSEEPAVDFLVRRTLLKSPSISFAGDKWIPGALSNFKQAIIHFLRSIKLRKYTKHKSMIIRYKLGRTSSKLLGRIVGFRKRLVRFPSFLMSFSDSNILRREANITTSLFFPNTGSSFKYTRDMSLPLNVAGLAPKLFLTSFIKEYVKQLRLVYKMSSGEKCRQTLVNPRVGYRLYVWRWMRRKFFLWPRLAKFLRRAKARGTTLSVLADIFHHHRESLFQWNRHFGYRPLMDKGKGYIRHRAIRFKTLIRILRSSRGTVSLRGASLGPRMRKVYLDMLRGKMRIIVAKRNKAREKAAKYGTNFRPQGRSDIPRKTYTNKWKKTTKFHFM